MATNSEEIRSSVTFLLVDSEGTARNPLRNYLREIQYQLIEASTIEEALDLIANNNPDLILLDLKMPISEVLSYLMKIRQSSNAPVIVLLESKNEKDGKVFLENGATDYIIKPFSLAELLARAQLFLKQKEGQLSEDPTS